MLDNIRSTVLFWLSGPCHFLRLKYLGCVQPAVATALLKGKQHKDVLIPSQQCLQCMTESMKYILRIRYSTRLSLH
eukprot:6053338-Amphidinium_carterae.1